MFHNKGAAPAVVFTAVLLIFFILNAGAQQDSIKTVVLNDVSVFASGKKPTQQLVHFFKANQSATLEDILGRLPEISLMRRGPYGMEPSIRSMNGGQINVLIGGMRLHGACTDKMDPPTIYVEPINLENLQLQTGSQGFLKGSSIGGTLDMKLAEPQFNEDEKLHGSVQSGYQSVSKGFYEAAVLNYNKGRWAFRGSGTYRKNANYTNGNGDEVLFSQYNKTNFSLSTAYRLTHQTQVLADVILDNGWDIGYPALPMDVGFARANLFSLAIRNTDASRKWSSREAKLYYNYVNHSMDDTKRPSVPMHMDMPGQSKTAGFYAEAFRRIGNRQTLQVRADGASTFLTASMTMYPPNESPMYMLTWPDNRRNQAGISASWQWKPDSTHNINISARLDGVQSMLASEEAKDHISITGGNTGSRLDLLKNLSLSASRKLHANWTLSANAGYAERMPTASELYGFYLYNAFDGYDYIGNTGLKTENAFNADASLAWQKPGIRLQATVFYSHISHYIMGEVDTDYSTMTIGAKGVKVYRQQGWAQLGGSEASVQWKMNSRWALVNTLRFTLAQHEYGDPLPFIAPLKNIGSLRYAFNRFSAQAEYEASAAQNRINESTGEMATPGFVLAHARVGYSFPLGKTQLGLQAGVENIFDEAYREHLDWGGILRPGRNIYMQVKVSF
jgi:iron complex outermembrane receptor protein